MGLFWQKPFAFPTCRSWWQDLRHSTKSLYMTSRLLLCRAAKEGGPGGNVRVPFLSPFLCGTTKKWHPSRHSAARSSMRVRRSSCLKFQLSILGPPHNARRVAYATSWHSPRSSQEGNQGDTPWHPTSRRLFESRRGFCFRKPPPSWAHERTPKMGLPWQEFLLSTPAARGSKT